MAQGTLKISTTAADGTIPVSGVSYEILDKSGKVLYRGTTDENGDSEIHSLEAPPALLSQQPDFNQIPYSVYDIKISKPGFADVNIVDVEIFAGQESIQPVNMEPLVGGGDDSLTYINPPPLASQPTPPQMQEGSNTPMNRRQRILPNVVIPEYITVHLGTPANTSARNVRVRFIDYVKNVASHEIYSTWPYNSLVANIHAIVTFAVNRIYTEWYRARGYPYDITNSTTVDQYYVHGGQVFQNISQITDGIFDVYARRQGFKNPYFTEYCNGTTATCRGLSQWGTVTLANQGLTPLEILRHYYPKDLELIEGPASDVSESYPGTALKLGMSSDDVKRIQLQLNRISANYPLIPKIADANGYFGTDTQEAVKVFQRTFNLTQDGVVGRSTWNKISEVFSAVTKLSELDGEGERIGLSANPPTVIIRQGSRGADVIHAQFLLDYIAEFYPEISAPAMDSVFGQSTAEAVKAFQRKFGLTADGIVGPATWRKLYEVYKTVQSKDPNAPSTPPTPSRPQYPGYLLRRGSRGEAVRTLQALINRAHTLYNAVPLVSEDGIFGPATESAVRMFQLYDGLSADGIVGPATWAHLIDI